VGEELMSEESKHMDDSFKRMSEEMKVSYNQAFWKDAEAKLNDAKLDDAFRAAALGSVAAPSFISGEGMDDLFMDDAFVDAASQQSMPYSSEFFNEFEETQGDMLMDDAFTTAASASVVDYLPKYWDGANQALTEEGLHYEYDSQYWDEARSLLDKSDRRIFFMKWSAVAALLLLFSLGGLMNSESSSEFDIATLKMSNEVNQNGIDKSLTAQSDINVSELLSIKEAKEFEMDNGNASDAVNGIQDSNNELAENVSNLLAEGEVESSPVLYFEETSHDLTEKDLDRKSINVNSAEFAALNIVEANNNSNSLLKDDIDKLTSPEMGLEFIAQNNLNSPLVKIEKYTPKATHNFSLVALGGIGNKWGSEDYIPTLRTSGGLEYMRSSFGRMRNFEFGGYLGFNHVRQNKLGTERRTSVYESNGEVSKYWYKISIKDMIFANANFLMNYRLSDKHKIKFGVGYEHKLAVNSNMSFKDSKSDEITTVNNNWGVKNGVRNSDVKVSLGYEFQLTNAFAFQLNGNFGLFDRTDNEFLNNSLKDNEMNVSIGLKYTFMRKI
jgi:hypothetical protein